MLKNASRRLLTARSRARLSSFRGCDPARRSRGQSAIEFALVWASVIMPLTAMLIFSSELLWVWHSVVEFTRDGARYAATHCYQGGGANVLTYMRANVPRMVDQDLFRDGQAEIQISYFQKNAETGTLEEFACDGGDCSRDCVPDVVRIRVTGYQFRYLFSYFGLPPLDLPNFSTTVPMESAGCSADSDSCLP